jgi:hypothetical protein
VFERTLIMWSSLSRTGFAVVGCRMVLPKFHRWARGRSRRQRLSATRPDRALRNHRHRGREAAANHVFLLTDGGLVGAGM